MTTLRPTLSLSARKVRAVKDAAQAEAFRSGDVAAGDALAKRALTILRGHVLKGRGYKAVLSSEIEQYAQGYWVERFRKPTTTWDAAKGAHFGTWLTAMLRYAHADFFKDKAISPDILDHPEHRGDVSGSGGGANEQEDAEASARTHVDAESFDGFGHLPTDRAKTLQVDRVGGDVAARQQRTALREAMRIARGRLNRAATEVWFRGIADMVGMPGKAGRTELMARMHATWERLCPERLAAMTPEDRMFWRDFVGGIEGRAARPGALKRSGADLFKVWDRYRATQGVREEVRMVEQKLAAELHSDLSLVQTKIVPQAKAEAQLFQAVIQPAVQSLAEELAPHIEAEMVRELMQAKTDQEEREATERMVMHVRGPALVPKKSHVTMAEARKARELKAGKGPKVPFYPPWSRATGGHDDSE